MVKGNKLIDNRVQIAVNIARIKRNGTNYEIAIDPDKAVAYKEGENIPIEEILNAQDVFSDMKKGLHSSEEGLIKSFNTTDINIITKDILDNGEIQFNQKYRDNLREQKYNRIVNIIHTNAIDPRSGLPHPEIRIRAAMQEAKVRVLDLKKAKDQVDTVVKALRPILPISFQKATLQVLVPAQFSAKVRSKINKQVNITKEDWLDDGSLSLKMELPAGLKNSLIDEINNNCHGGCTIQETK